MNETACRVCHLIWPHLSIFTDGNLRYHLAEKGGGTTDIVYV